MFCFGCPACLGNRVVGFHLASRHDMCVIMSRLISDNGHVCRSMFLAGGPAISDVSRLYV